MNSDHGVPLNEDGIPDATSRWPSVSTLSKPTLKWCPQHRQPRGVHSEEERELVY